MKKGIGTAYITNPNYWKFGTEIYYNPGLSQDTAWSNHIDHMWNRRKVLSVLNELPGLKLQPKTEQSKFKISFYYDAAIAPDVNEINNLLHQHEESHSLPDY